MIRRLPGVGLLRRVAEPVGWAHVRPNPTWRTSGDSGIVTVLSTNLWHDWPRHRNLHLRLESLARLIEDEAVDVALLQEVARTPDMKTDEWLADRLGMSCVYSRSNGDEEVIRFEEGLAVLSRHPMEGVRVRELGSTPFPLVHRAALRADVQVPHGPLTFFSVHLGLLPRWNARQFEHLRHWVQTTTRGEAAVVGGDFNAHETTPQILRARRSWLDLFRHLHPDGEAPTHRLRLLWGKLVRQRRLDYLFLSQRQKSWVVVEAAHVESRWGAHSDHRAVLARLAPVAV